MRLVTATPIVVEWRPLRDAPMAGVAPGPRNSEDARGATFCGVLANAAVQLLHFGWPYAPCCARSCSLRNCFLLIVITVPAHTEYIVQHCHRNSSFSM
jgi:hypothetical protein